MFRIEGVVFLKEVLILDSCVNEGLPEKYQGNIDVYDEVFDVVRFVERNFNLYEFSSSGSRSGKKRENYPIGKNSS